VLPCGDTSLERIMRHLSALTLAFPLAALIAAGCGPEPLEEAPVSIDDPIRHLWVHFDDEQPDALNSAIDEFTAHLLLCEDDTEDLPECDLENGLSTTMLTTDELAELVDSDRMAGYPDAEYLDAAESLVVGRRMPITVDIIEDVLIQPNQDEVFPHFDTYERTYLTSMDDYLAGDEEFLNTTNEVVSDYILTQAAYTLLLDFRQWTWSFDGTAHRVVGIRSWLYDGAELPSDNLVMAFTYSLEILIPYVHDDTETWRTQALWAHADITDLEEEEGFWEDALRDGTIDGFDQMQTWVDENY